MKLVSFCMLTALSLLYALLTFTETLTYQKWEKALNDQKYIQARVAYFDHVNMVLDQMVRRMALDSQHDPAIAQLLKQNNINVVMETPAPTKDTPAGFGTPPPNPTPPPPPDKPAQVPPNTAPLHP